MPLDFVAVDFETANHNPWSVCAIGVAFVRDGRVSQALHLLVRPPSSLFVPVVCVHGLAWRDVRRQPTFAEVWSDLGPRLKGEILVAHSASFDRRVLSASLRRFRLRHALNDFV